MAMECQRWVHFAAADQTEPIKAHIARPRPQQTIMKTHKNTITYNKLTLTYLDKLVGAHPSAASHQVDMSESRCPPR